MRRYEKIFAAAIVAVPLVLGFLGAPLTRADTADLNRLPTKFPEIRVSAILASETYADIGAWLRDRMPLRAKIRTMEAKFNRGVFRDVDDPAILQGKDGWLYFDPAISLGLRYEFDPADVRAGILRLKTQVEAAGKTFLFAIAPHKETVYPQYLMDRDRRRQEIVRERLESFRELMRREPVGGFIDAWDTLEAAAAASPTPLYYPRDTHWSPVGAIEMSRLVVEVLAPNMKFNLNPKLGRLRPYTPDLVLYSGLDEKEMFPAIEFFRPGVTWERAGEEMGTRTRTVRFLSHSKRKASPLLPQKLVVITDSYGMSMPHSLRPFFRESTFIMVGSGYTELARKALAEADVVLFIRVERFMYDISAERPFSADSIEVLDLLGTLAKRQPDGLTRAPSPASGTRCFAAAPGLEDRHPSPCPPHARG